MQPMVGVVVPCYNHGKYIKECLESILSQDYPSIDVALVDNGSKDNSKDVVSLLSGPTKKGNVWSFSNTARMGAAGARNQGIQMLAHCNYFLFLDADDILEPNVLTHMVAVLDEYKDIGMVYGDYSIFVDGTDIEWREYKEPYSRRRVEQECFINTPLVRGETLMKVGPFDTELDGQEDFDMWIRLTECALAYHIPISVVKTRHAETNTYDRVSPSKYRAGMERIYAKLNHRKQLAGVS